jgi:hypothetical protein
MRDDKICWEYKQISLPGIMDNEVNIILNVLGDEGWELVNTVVFKHAYKAVLKRRLW